MSDGVAALRHIIADYAEDIEQVMLDEEWEQLATILQQRQKLMEDKIPPLVNEKRRIDLVDVIKKIQAEDAVFLSVLQEKKQELEKKFRYIRHGKQAIKAYEL